MKTGARESLGENSALAGDCMSKQTERQHIDEASDKVINAPARISIALVLNGERESERECE